MHSFPMHIVCCMVSQGGADLQGHREGEVGQSPCCILYAHYTRNRVYVCAVCEYICI